MPITLIITVYKDYEALDLVLQSVSQQKSLPSQVLIAHDTVDKSINEVLSKFKSKLSIDYVNQEDTGFNKNRILNKCLLMARHDKIVFIDGDCVLHPRFIQAYQKNIIPGFFAAGRRIDLDEKSANTLREDGFKVPSIVSMVKHKTKRIEEAFYLPFVPQSFLKTPKLLGCNMGWWKADLMALNGFDMDYQLPGFGEDTDLEWRAKLNKMKPFSMRWKAIQYHLHHERPQREDAIEITKEIFLQKKEKAYFYCENGISNLEQDFNS